MSSHVLAYGWYGRGNLGDELMYRALISLFHPRGVHVHANDHLTVDKLKHAKGVVFGGGSILWNAPSAEKEALDLLLSGKVPVFYMGVGVETGIHPTHQALMKVAKKVITRTPDREFDWMPDLVYSLDVAAALPAPAQREGLLIVPNVEVLPTHANPHWMHVAWERYKDEFAQLLDDYVDKGIKPTFMLMCKNPNQDDLWAACELIARMRHRSTKFNFVKPEHELEAIMMMRSHQVVITQRFHGIVLAEAAGVAYVSVDHHDKLKQASPHRGERVEYHGANKSTLHAAIERARTQALDPFQLDPGVYGSLADEVVKIINEGTEHGV